MSYIATGSPRNPGQNSHGALMRFGELTLRKLVQNVGVFDVWQGELNADQRPCLVRRVLPPYTSSPEVVEAFRSRCTQLIKHPVEGALTVIDQGECDETPFVAFALPPGWTLQRLLDLRMTSGSPLPLPLALHITTTLIHTLLRARCVHGSLSAETVWIAQDGTPLLAGLEIGSLAEMAFGSLEGHHERAWRYIAPERAGDWVNPPPAVDVYSICNLLLELLVLGRFSLVQTRLEPHELLSLLGQKEVPLALEDLIRQGLELEPSHRPSLETLLEQLHAVRNGLESASDQTLQAWLSQNAPPIEVLDPLERRDPTVDADIQERLQRAQRKAAAEEGKVLPPSNSSASRGPERPWGMMLLVLVALVGTLWYAGPTLKGLFGPSGAGMVVLRVDATPQGAQVFVGDGTTGVEEALGTAPLTTAVHTDSTGGLEVAVRLKGHRTVRKSFATLADGEEVKLTVALEPVQPGPSELQVITLPPGAKITVDGVARGESPATVGDLLSTEPHTVALTLAGHHPVEQKVTVSPEEPLLLRITLEKLGGDKSGGRDGSSAKAQKPDAASPAATAAGKKGADVAAAARLPIEGPVGFLIVEALPDAQLFVDGEDKGWTGKGRKLPFAAGRHEIELRSRKGQKAQRAVTVRAGETRRLSYDFHNSGWRLDQEQPF